MEKRISSVKYDDETFTGNRNKDIIFSDDFNWNVKSCMTLMFATPVMSNNRHV